MLPLRADTISCAKLKNRLFAVNIEEYPICLYLLIVDRIQWVGLYRMINPGMK